MKLLAFWLVSGGASTKETADKGSEASVPVLRCSDNFPEAFQQALDVLSKRWTGLILFVLGDGPLRFSEISERIQVISDRVLSERLKELEAEGIVERRISAEVPVRVEYRLTDKGQELRPVYEAIGRWAHRWVAGAAEAMPECFAEARTDAD